MTERRKPIERRLTVGGLSFRVLTSTRSRRTERPTYVIVHGIGASHRYSAPLHAQLSEAGDVHSIDLPGFGGLPKPPSSLGVPEMAHALGEVLTRIGVEGTVLIGHSMGSQWVVELAVQRPDLATSVVVIGPVTDDEHRSMLAQSIALARDTLGETPTVNAIVFTDYVRCGPVWYAKQLRHMLTYPLEDAVTSLAVPLLVIRGGNDPIAGVAWSRRVRDAASAGSLITVPGHRHVVQATAPRAVASAIDAFLGSVPTPVT